MKNAKRFIPAILLTAIAASTLTMTFAWFITNINISLSSDTNVKIEVGNDLDVCRLLDKTQSTDPDTWSRYGDAISFNVSSSMTDITGDGLTFQSPTAVSKRTGDALPDMYHIPSNKHDGYYVDLNLKVRCNFDCSLYLADGSYIKPKSSTSVDSEPSRRASHEVFSPDYIAGAARVALLEDVCDANLVKTGENLVQIWIPNDKYEATYVCDTSGAKYPNGFFQNGFREEKYGYQKDNADRTAVETVYYTDTDYLTNKVIVGNNCLAKSATQMADHSLPIVSFNNNGTMQEKRFTVRVWFEGFDRESNDVTNFGQVDYYFKFITMGKSYSDPTEDAKLANITCNSATVESETCYQLFNTSSSQLVTAADKIIYSFDGIDWNAYTDKLVFPVKKERRKNSEGSYVYDDGQIVIDETILEKNKVYIRNAETINHFHGTYQAVTVPIPEEGD